MFFFSKPTIYNNIYKVEYKVFHLKFPKVLTIEQNIELFLQYLKPV